MTGGSKLQEELLLLLCGLLLRRLLGLRGLLRGGALRLGCLLYHNKAPLVAIGTPD